MESRRKKTQKAIELKKKKNEERRAEIGGSARAYHKNKNEKDSSKNKSKVTTKGNFVTYKGKRYLKTSTMGKRAIAIQKRDKLASKNYMSKAMIEKRKKRLKIKK